MKEVILKSCPDCGKLLRPQRTKAADYPGTIMAKGRGLCTWDYLKRVKNGTLDQIPLAWDVNSDDLDPVAKERVERMKRDAILWHRDWRKRTGRDHTAPIDLRDIIRTAA